MIYKTNENKNIKYALIKGIKEKITTIQNFLRGKLH